MTLLSDKIDPISNCCLETPKLADIICEQPQTIPTKILNNRFGSFNDLITSWYSWKISAPVSALQLCSQFLHKRHLCCSLWFLCENKENFGGAAFWLIIQKVCGHAGRRQRVSSRQNLPNNLFTLITFLNQSHFHLTISSLSHHILKLQISFKLILTKVHCINVSKSVIIMIHQQCWPNFPIVKVESNVFALYRSNTKWWSQPVKLKHLNQKNCLNIKVTKKLPGEQFILLTQFSFNGLHSHLVAKFTPRGR